MLTHILYKNRILLYLQQLGHDSNLDVHQQINKKLWYIYTMEYYSAIKRNAFESVLMRWMNLEPIIQSEVSQKEKNKYYTLTHIYGIWKHGIDEPISRAAMETQTQRTDLWTRAGGGRKGMDRVTWKHTLPYVKQIAKGKSLYDSGKSNWGSVTRQMGVMGREVREMFKWEGT